MPDFTAAKFDGIFHFEYALCCLDQTFICFLTAACGIERSLFHEYRACLSVRQGFCDFRLGRNHRNLGFMCQFVISDKYRSYFCRDLIIYGSVCSHIVCHFTCRSCFHSLFFHSSFEAIFIYCEPFFFKNFLCKIKREAIRIIQFECICAGESLFSFLLHFFFHLF